MKSLSRSSLLVACSLLMLSGCDRQSTSVPQAQTPAPSVGDVTFEFKMGDTETSLVVSDVSDGTTLEKLMREIAEPEISISGSGTTAFVHAIGDVSTSGSQGWTFKVDGKWADRGIGALELHPPTTVRWEFGDWDAESR